MRRMKVTANLPDTLIQELREIEPGKNLTQALQIAIEAWVKRNRIRRVVHEVREQPLEFNTEAEDIREINRR